MTSWDLPAMTTCIYPAFEWKLGLPQRGKDAQAQGYLGIQCRYGKITGVLWSNWDSCTDLNGGSSGHPACYTNFGKTYHGPTPQNPNRLHNRAAPQHPNCNRNCQDCSGSKATGTKCWIGHEVLGGAPDGMPCDGKFELRVRQTHPQ